jgi:hypothetical protein
MNDEAITLIPFSSRSAWEQATLGSLPSQSWGHASGLVAGGIMAELAVVRSQGARMLLPFHRRQFDGATDIVTLPGLSGALISPTSAAPIEAWSRFAKSQGWVCGYIQLSPLNDALDPPLQPDEIRSNNALYVFDLETWKIGSSVGYNMRRKLRVGDHLGAKLITDPERLAEAFPRLYLDHLTLMGSAPDFTENALEQWFAAPGILAFGAELNGQIVNIQMGRRHGTWADLHLAGATPEGRELQAWLIWQAIESLGRDGLYRLNIGGYGSHGDQLHWMKARFGANEHPLRALRQIYDPARFAQLCHQTGADPQASFFPPYRGAMLPGPTPQPQS